MCDFVHLHNHTHYSLLDAACTPEQLIKEAKKYDQKALALTDHGVMFGCLEFYYKAKKEKIKPLIGFEAYVANGSRFDNTSGKQKSKRKNYASTGNHQSGAFPCRTCSPGIPPANR